MNFVEWFTSLPQVVLIILAIFDLTVRGIALWKSARNGEKYWFVGLLVINSMGLIPLLYLAFFDKSSRFKKKKK